MTPYEQEVLNRFRPLLWAYFHKGVEQEQLESFLLSELAAKEKEVREVVEEAEKMSDAAEMLWVVLASVSGGDWTKQSEEWQEAAARWRDNYFQGRGSYTKRKIDKIVEELDKFTD